MLHSLALLRIDISKEFIASIIRETRIGELGKVAVTNNRSSMRNIPEDNILQLRSLSRKVRDGERKCGYESGERYVEKDCRCDRGTQDCKRQVTELGRM
jgi:hypothetical protein